MKKVLCCLLFLNFVSASVYANIDTLETKQDAYYRQSNQNYQTYRNNNYQAPLGGYQQPLGSSTNGYHYGYQQKQYNSTNTNSYNYNNNSNRNNYWGY